HALVRVLHSAPGRRAGGLGDSRPLRAQREHPAVWWRGVGGAARWSGGAAGAVLPPGAAAALPGGGRPERRGGVGGRVVWVGLGARDEDGGDRRQQQGEGEECDDDRAPWVGLWASVTCPPNDRGAEQGPKKTPRRATWLRASGASRNVTTFRLRHRPARGRRHRLACMSFRVLVIGGRRFCDYPRAPQCPPPRAGQPPASCGDPHSPP